MSPETLLRRAALVAAVLCAACQPTAATDPKMVSEWMHSLYGAIRVERLSPPVASRLTAYASAALYAGLAAADPALEPLAGRLNGFPELPSPADARAYDPTVVAVAAERVVLDSLLRDALPTTRAALTRLADSLARSRDSVGVLPAERTRSEELGSRIGAAIVAWSRTDGFDSTRVRAPWVPPAGDAYWVNDSPLTTYAAQNLSGASELVAPDNPANLVRAGAVSDRGLVLNRPKLASAKSLPPVNMAGMAEPYWGTVRPFALERWDACPAPEPPPYATDSAATLYRDAHDLHIIGASLTPDQRAVALFWADNPGESGTPVGHWLSIASQMVSERKLTANDAARLMLLTSVAQADAFVASWGYKYRHNLIRPRTYIRRLIDSTWEPLIPTPPFPEYPSGHSTVSAAAAEVMVALLGDGAFDDSTGLTIGHAVRRFDSFRAAAREAGQSRVYAGIHFTFGNLGGRALGECIGATVVERLQGDRRR
ncbi:MAG TPA: vanadium-dependent haloperoxidase [Gemmatimonadaceae bacterium]|nr:vanadium-dependent haloperoxidase [Gemmatimonadaceae bacterium]